MKNESFTNTLQCCCLLLNMLVSAVFECYKVTKKTFSSVFISVE
jgi:hypothetical protein